MCSPLYNLFLCVGGGGALEFEGCMALLCDYGGLQKDRVFSGVIVGIMQGLGYRGA